MNYILIRSFRTSPFKMVSFILLLLTLSGCLSVKPSTTKSGQSYFETFYVGEDGTQYFIKPLVFKTKNADENLLLDLTFRYRNEIKDSAIVNFSIISSSIYKTIDSLNISNKNIKVESKKVGLLFNEKNNSGFTSRFTTKISVKEVKDLFNNNEWEFTIHNQDHTTKYFPHGKASRAISTLRDKVFILM